MFGISKDNKHLHYFTNYVLERTFECKTCCKNVNIFTDRLEKNFTKYRGCCEVLFGKQLLCNRTFVCVFRHLFRVHRVLHAVFN